MRNSTHNKITKTIYNEPKWNEKKKKKERPNNRDNFGETEFLKRNTQ